MTLYDELELSSDCSQEAIKQQYRILAHRHHPDRGGDEERFKKIKLAYEVLSDTVRRAEYDRTGNFKEDFTIRSEAIERLGNMINHYVPTINTEMEDLILRMRLDVNQAVSVLVNEIANCQRSIHNANIAYKKTWVKNKGENVLKTFIENLIKRRENDLVMLQRRMAVFNLMLEILENYHYGATEWQLMLDNNEIQVVPTN